MNLSTESRWCAWCRCNCSWSYYEMYDCKAYLPMADRAESGSLIPTCALTFTSYYVIWKYWLMPKSISVPCNAVTTKICPGSWVRNMSYCSPDHGQVLLILRSFCGIFNTDVLISACCFLFLWFCWPRCALLALSFIRFLNNKTSRADSNLNH